MVSGLSLASGKMDEKLLKGQKMRPIAPGEGV
jgi:hypothetical protein